MKSIFADLAHSPGIRLPNITENNLIKILTFKLRINDLIIWILDIFAAFDPENIIFINLHQAIWVFVILSPLYLFGLARNRFRSANSVIIQIIYDLVKRRKATKAPAAFSFILSVFTMILIYNFVGLAPYTFSWTRHIIVNFGLAFTLWLRIVMIRALYRPTSFLAHLVPRGSPAPLAPFLVLIETVRITVRPVTLAVRLTANIMTGHIIITLLSEADRSLISKRTTVLILLLIISYFIFEMAVCLVQAYIFTLLPVLYIDEHTEK